MKRLLDSDSLRALARGCAVLGAGGGGDPYIGLMQALQATEDFGLVTLVDLDELPDDGLIMPCGMIGAPTVSIEKILNGDEGGRLREHLECMTGRRVAALMAAESGPVTALIAEIGAFRLAAGKVVDVERRTTKGFVRGSVIVEGMGADAGKLIRLELQNENLVALERGRVLASVPDLITVLDS